MNQAHPVAMLRQRIADILGNAGLPTDVTTAVDQEFTQCINDMDKAPKARKPAKRRAAAPAKKRSASSKRRKVRR